MTDQEHHIHRLFMHRAMELAVLGQGHVSPNPMVGCVIVHQGKIISEGWHREYGKEHAEVHAIQGTRDKSLLKDSTLYVNLEPCSHVGKTPPCADLILKSEIKKVVLSNPDPNPKVGGKGIQKLREGGVEVITHVLEKEGLELNRRFFTWIHQQRPYILLKWAQTANGFMARPDLAPAPISNAYSRQLVHRWRSEEDSVLVGSQTALHDNPRLNVREWSGRDPVRVVLDRFLKLPATLNVWDGTQMTFRYNTLKESEGHNLKSIQVSEKNFIPDVIHDLYKRNIQSVMVEGGAQTLQAWIDLGMWDEIRIFTSPHAWEQGIVGPSFKGQRYTDEDIMGDRLQTYRANNNTWPKR